MERVVFQSRIRKLSLIGISLAVSLLLATYSLTQLLGAFTELRPIADDYGNMANTYNLGFFDQVKSNFLNWNSSLSALLVATGLFHLAVYLPWSYSYLPIVALMGVIVFLTMKNVLRMTTGSNSFVLNFLFFPIIFVLWIASLSTFGSVVESFHFYSVFGWISNSPRVIFSWILILVIIKLRTDTKASKISISGFFLTGFFLSAFGAVEGFVAFVSISLLSFLLNGTSLIRLARNKTGVAIVLGCVLGTVVSAFGPGSATRSQTSQYAINSPDQIFYITVGEFAKHWGETMGNVVYLMVFVICVGLSSVYFRAKSEAYGISTNKESEQVFKDKTNLFRFIVLVASWLLLSLATAFASGFVYSAPWHVVGVRQIFFVAVVYFGFFVGIKVSSFSKLGIALLVPLTLSILIFGPLNSGITQMKSRNASWIVQPSPYGYMADREQDWVLSDAHKLKIVSEELGKEFPKLDKK